MKKLTKKGFTIMDVPTLAITLGIIAIVIGIMATVLVNMQSTQCEFSWDDTNQVCLNSTGGSGGELGLTAQYNITQQGLDAQEDFSEWQGTWVVIIAAAVVIGIVGAYLFFRPRG